jgi:hypothetical protein
MEQQQNPTGGDSGASTPTDPIDRFEAFLAAQDADTSGQPDDAGDGDAEPKNAAKTTDKPDGDDQAKDAGPQITTSQLAQFLGIDEADIDVDEDGSPIFKNKIDGKESTAKFQDIRKAYQLQGHAENTTRAAAEAQKAAQARLQEADQVIQARFQQQQQEMQVVQQLAASLREDLNNEYKAVPWDDLWRNDAGQARALERRFEERLGRINGADQQIRQQAAQAAQQLQAQQQANVQRTLQAEAQKLREVIPEWADRATAVKEQGELTEWAMSRGYDPRYLDALHNALVPNAAVVIRDLRNAWKHDTLQKSTPEIENRLRQAPKLVKPGQPVTQGEHQAANRKSLLQNIKSASQTHSTKAFEEFLLKTGQT